MLAIRSCLLASVVSLLALSGCAPANGHAQPSQSGPKVMALSTYSASLGTPIDVFVKNLPRPAQGIASLHFRGTYLRRDGGVEQVNLLTPAKRIDASTLRWSNFGPFDNPFNTSPKPDAGVFQGTIVPRVVLADGTIVDEEGSADRVTFQVRPSLVIEDFQPAKAACGGPAKRAFGGFSYRTRVRAIGFTPTRFVYELQTPHVVGVTDPSDNTMHSTLARGQDGLPEWRTTQLIHDATSEIDLVDGQEAFYLPTFPDGVRSYDIVLTVSAEDGKGQSYSTALAMQTQQPIDFYYDGRFQLAQIYPAVPVSSCMPGGPQGRLVSYTETQSETRSRAYTLTISQSWLSAVSHTDSSNVQNSWSSSDGKTYSRSITNTSGWADSKSLGVSNTKGTSTTDGTSSTNGNSGSNAFALGFNGSSSMEDSQTVVYSNEKGGFGDDSTEVGANASLTVGGSTSQKGEVDVGLVVVSGKAKGSLTESGSLTLAGSGRTGHTDRISYNETNGTQTKDGGIETGGWTTNGVSTSGSNSSTTGSSSTTSSASTTQGTVDTSTVSGSTASTDTKSATHIDTTSGSTSTGSSDESTSTEGGGMQQGDGWLVSSTTEIGNGFSGLVVAGTYGVFYRQMARYQRQAFLIEYDKCGDGDVIGVATLDDYAWAPDLAPAAECPPLPVSNFPKPQCFLPPCESTN